jgi:AGZA family xanthine/uracil permease-like MFS transporter
LDKYFHITERNSNIRTEIIAGVTTFMTMAYIIVVNPGILTAALGQEYFGALLVATCLAAALSTLLMGLVAKYPFALAPGMGLNAVLTFGIVIGMHLSWQIAMALIFIEGLVVLILVLTNLRELVMNSIPSSLKLAIGVAIGLFIAFIGFKDSGLMVANSATFVGFGSMSSPVVIVSLIGLILIMVMMALKIKGSILYGILLTSFIALVICFFANSAGIAFNVYGNQGVAATAGAALAAGQTNLPSWGGSIIELPSAATLSTVAQLDIMGALNIGILTLLSLVFALGMVDFFDTMGTVVAVGGQAKLLDKDGKLPGLRNVLVVDSLAAMIGGFMGCSSNTTYVESASGVSAGGRTGLASVVTAVLFLVAMLFVPLAYLIPGAATAPALIIVGFLMLTLVKDIPWDKLEEALPAFLTIAAMVFTFSISKGIGFGFISYCVIKTATGKWREVHPVMWIVAVVFALYFVFVSSII